ncbi:MAG TPA: c-type cytochrome [Caulobacteraceae bacterium]
MRRFRIGAAHGLARPALAWLVLGSAAVSLAGCATPGPEATWPVGPQAQAGGAFVARSCAGCHAVGVSGASTDPAAPPFRRLAATRSPAALAEALGKVAEHGHVQMPPIYTTQDERTNVLAYLAQLKRHASPRS